MAGLAAAANGEVLNGQLWNPFSVNFCQLRVVSLKEECHAVYKNNETHATPCNTKVAVRADMQQHARTKARHQHIRDFDSPPRTMTLPQERERERYQPSSYLVNATLQVVFRLVSVYAKICSS